MAHFFIKMVKMKITFYETEVILLKAGYKWWVVLKPPGISAPAILDTMLLKALHI